MHDRVAGDLCPECATPFDDRPEWKGVREETLFVFRCGVGSVALIASSMIASIWLREAAIFLWLAGMVLAIYTLAVSSWEGTDPRMFRVSRRWMRFRMAGKACAWCSILHPLVIVAIIIIVL